MGDKKSTREILLNNATYLFYDIGFEATTMRLIAEKSGITHPALFHRFKNKAEIATVLVRRFLKGILRITEKYLEAEHLSPDCDEALLFYWTAYFYYCRYDSNLFRFLSEFSNASRRDYDSVCNDYYTQIFRNLMNWNYATNDIEYRLYSMLLGASADILAKTAYRGDVSVSKAVEEMTNIVYGIVRIERPYHGSDVEQFVNKLDRKYLSYSVLEDFLLTDLGDLYDDEEDSEDVK